MPDRVVNYLFRGNFGNLTAGLTTAGRNVTELGTKMVALDKNGARMRAGLTQVGQTGGRVGLVFAAGVAVAVRAAANFEQAMSNVQAATHETAGNMALLRKAALDAGQATQYSATEAAGAIEELAKAGVSTTDILDGGLDGALNLAAAGGLEVADAAQIAATALTQFRLEGEDVPHVADLLAAAAGKAQGDVTDMSMALKQSGLVAAQMNVSIEETTGTLAAFASAGLLGSDAGTSFRTMLLRLANPTKESGELMRQLGIEAYDAQGNFVGIQSLAGQLAVAFDGQSQAQRDAALATIFGSDAIRAANVLYAQGADGIQNWTKQVDDAGYAAETAATKQENLKGDLEKLGGAFETALIGAGSSSQGPLRELVQDATKAVELFNKLPAPVQATATALAAIIAVTGGGLWFGSKVVRGVADTREALDQLGFSAKTTTGRLARIGATGATILVAAQAMGALVNATLDLGNAVNGADVARDLEAIANGRTTDSLGTLASALEGVNEAGAGTANALFSIPSAVTGIPTSFETSTQTIEQFDQALASLVEGGNAEQAAAAFQAIRDAAAEHGGVSDADVVKRFDAYATALENIAAAGSDDVSSQASLYTLLGGEAPAAAGAAAGAVDALGVAQRQAAEAADLQQAAIEDAVKAMQDQTSAALDAFDAVTQYRQAVKEATKQADRNNAGIADSSKAALANRDALAQLAGAWNSQSQVVTDNVKKYREARANFIQTAEAMGVPRKAARQLADTLLEMPQSKVIPVSVPGADVAKNQLQQVRGILDTLNDRTINVRINRYSVGEGGPGVLENPRGLKGGADGMTVPGPRHPYGDKLIVAVAPGEEIISNRYGQADRFRADRAAGRIPGYADGGTAGARGDKKGRVRASLFVDPELADLLYGAKGAAGALKVLQGQAERSQKALDKERKSLEAATSQRDSFSASVGSAYAKADLFSGGLSDFDTGLSANTNDTAAAMQALGLAAGKGLDGGLYAALAASGNSSLLQEFAGLSAADIDQRERQYAGMLAGQNALGNSAAEIAGLNKTVIDLQAAVKEQAATNRELKHALNQLEPAVERGARKGSESGSERGSERGSEKGSQRGQENQTFGTATRKRTGG